MKHNIYYLLAGLFSVIIYCSCGGPEPQETMVEYKLENITNHSINLVWSDTTIGKVLPNDFATISIGDFVILQRDEDFDINPFGTADSVVISFDNQKNLTIYKNDTTDNNIMNPNSYQTQKLQDGSDIFIKYIDEEYYNMSK